MPLPSLPTSRGQHSEMCFSMEKPKTEARVGGGGGDMEHSSDPRSEQVDLVGRPKQEGFTLPRV